MRSMNRYYLVFFAWWIASAYANETTLSHKNFYAMLQRKATTELEKYFAYCIELHSSIIHMLSNRPLSIDILGTHLKAMEWELRGQGFDNTTEMQGFFLKALASTITFTKSDVDTLFSLKPFMSVKLIYQQLHNNHYEQFLRALPRKEYQRLSVLTLPLNNTNTFITKIMNKLVGYACVHTTYYSYQIELIIQHTCQNNTEIFIADYLVYCLFPIEVFLDVMSFRNSYLFRSNS